jgi:hypothetical protein
MSKIFIRTRRALSVLTLASGLLTAHAREGSRAEAQTNPALEWTPIHEGGSQWRVRPAAFEVAPGTTGRLGDDGFFVQTGSQLLASCYIKTPWVPVPSPSEVMLFPGLDALWTRLVARGDSADLPLTTFQVEIKRTNGRVEVRDFDLGTRDIAMKVAFVDPEGSILYRGSLQTSVEAATPLTYAFRVDVPVELRVKLCYVFEDTRLQIRDIALRVFPVK